MDVSPGSRFSTAVDDRIREFLVERRTAATAISADLAPVFDAVDALASGGKRLRAGFLHWGWHAVAAARPDATHTTGSPSDPEWQAVVTTSAAVEVFHAAALVHDDVMDSSDTRRGAPSVHRGLERVHREREWRGRADAFGVNGAILAGDLLLGWSDDLARAGLAALPDDRRDAATRLFSTMREEVGYGQFLDVLEEAAWARQEPRDLLQRAHTVAVYKSARYSVEAPLLLGAAMAGGSPQQRDALSDYGVRVGTAFQMRDDILGVFGDPAATGKPAGDDLREGKRTVLVELARRELASGPRTTLDELLGDPDLAPSQIQMLQRTIAESGALERLESMIDRDVGEALESLRDAHLSRGAVLELERLAAAAADRDR